MAGAFTRLDIVIEGIRFVDQGGFGEVMDRFYHFLDVQFGIRPAFQEAAQAFRQPPPRSAPRPKLFNWRKTLGLSADGVVGVREIDHAFRNLVKKLRPDRIDHATNNRRRERWERVLKAREMGIKEVTR